MCAAVLVLTGVGQVLAQPVARPPVEKVGYSGPAPTDRSAPSLFKAYCLNCHGVGMEGDGPMASQLRAPVRSLRLGLRVSSAADATAFTAADVATVVERGVPGAAMPAFAGVFSKVELQALSRHVLTLLKVDPNTPLLDLGTALDPTAENVMEGASIYARAGCATCHGLDGRGGPDASLQGWKNEDGTRARWPRLHRPVEWRGGPTARDVAVRVARGIPGTPMPAYRPLLKDKELLQLGLYVETMAEVTTVEELAAQWVSHVDETPPAARGAHLLATQSCTGCHRWDARNTGPEVTAVDVGPFGVFLAGPLLPRSLGNDRAELKDLFHQAVTQGRGYDGRRLFPLAMPWPHLETFSETDADAVVAALLERPRAPNPAPPPLPASWTDQVIGKLSALARLTVVEVRIQAYAQGVVGGPSPRLVGATVLAASLGVWLFLLMLAVGGPKRSRRKRTVVAFVPLPVGVALAFLMVWPAYEFRPDFTVRRGLAATLPDPQGLTNEASRLLAERGRVLVAQAGCANCHTAQNPYRLLASDPLTGGARVRSEVFGRTYAANLTGHDATGLGTWSRQQLRRALRGGIGKDARVIHWDAMPHPQTAGWLDEELEAVVTYLKALPPMEHRVPPPEPGDDLEGVGLSLFDYAE